MLSVMFLAGCDDISHNVMQGEVVSFERASGCCQANKLTIKLDGGETISFYTSDSSKWRLLTKGQKIKVYHTPSYTAKYYEHITSSQKE